MVVQQGLSMGSRFNINLFLSQARIQKGTGGPEHNPPEICQRWGLV